MRRFIKRLGFILQIHRFIPFFRDFLLSKKVNKGKKIFSILIIVGYFLFPFDLIPDFVMMFGLFDDIVVLSIILQHIVKIAPQDLKDKYKLTN